MTLNEKIRKNWITARKAKDTNAASILGMLVSATNAIAKEHGEVTDDKAIGAVKKLMKQNQDVLDILTHRGTSTEYDKLVAENAVLEVYLPAMANDTEVRAFIESAISHGKNMGQIMGALKQAYGQTVDMKMASALVKELTA